MRQKIKGVLLSLLGLYLLFGFFVVPYLITTQVPQIVKKQLGTQLSINDASFDPFGFELHLKEIRFSSPKGEPLFRLKESIVNVELYALFMGTIRLKEVGFIEPELFILKDKAGTFNFSWLLESNQNQPKALASKDQNSALPAIVMEYFYIKDAGIVYNDISKEVAFSVALSQLGLRIHDIDTKNIQNSDGRIRFFTHINDGGFIDVKSEVLSLEPLALQGSVNFESGKIFTGWSYLQEILNLEIADGKMSAHTDFFFDSDDLNATRLEAIALRLEHLRVKPKNEHHDILTIKAIDLKEGTLFPLQQVGTFERLAINDVALHVKRLADGALNWQQYAKIASDANATPPPEPKNRVEKPWDVTLKDFTLTDFKADIYDEGITPSQHFVLDALNLHVKDISSDQKHTFSYESNMRINDAGKLFLSGDVRPEPLLVNTAINLQSLQLRDANPYIAQSLKLYLDRGSVDMIANMRFEPDTSHAQMQMKGDVTIKDFVANASDNDKTIIAFNKISAAPFYFDLKPDRLAIEELEIASMYSNIHIDTNKTLNFSKLLIKKPESNQTATVADANSSDENKEAFALNIVKLDFKDAVADFADDSLPLKFYTNIHDVGGTIYGLSTDQDLTSYVNFSGVVDQYGAMKVDGSLNSGNPKMFTDISVNFRNLALNNMSPYSANFAGRKIDEGKLSLDLKYTIVESQILGENAIIINKIKLGEKFEGESSLPLSLAIALLEDNDGVIDIDMPVQGDMDAPDFKYGALVMKTLGNLIIKVVSAPFRFLGSMLGIDGEKLKFIAYEPGQSSLLPPEREKLDALAKALQKRQKILLEVSGSYDLKADRFALQRQKLQELVLKRSDQKEKNVLLDLDYVEDLYDEFYDDKSRDALETSLEKKYEKRVAFEEAYRNALIEKVILKQEVSPEELDFLARARSVSIKNYLKVTHAIDASRIILADNSVSEKSEEGLINSEMNIVVKE